ncbi:MAG: DUF2231 domain-containing protein [Bacteroidetes bacterium]|nr:DUF2231 domain-containing protein [Bacteroidota bacterium]
MFNPSHIHPMVVHFPIALIMVGFLAEFLGLFINKEKCLTKMGFYLMLLGALAAIVAWSTGYFLTSELDGAPGLLRAKHKLFATLTLITIIVTSIFRIVITYKKHDTLRLRYLYSSLFFLAVIFVGITGYLGGSLAFDF